MIRHLIPRMAWRGWASDALTIDPNGAVEMPPGFNRQMRMALRQPTITPQNDEVEGRTLAIQWLGIMVELAIGRVR